MTAPDHSEPLPRLHGPFARSDEGPGLLDGPGLAGGQHDGGREHVLWPQAPEAGELVLVAGDGGIGAAYSHLYQRGISLKGRYVLCSGSSPL